MKESDFIFFCSFVSDQFIDCYGCYMRSTAQIFNYNWIADIARGDQKAFACFFHAFRNKVYSFSLSFTRSAEVAEEITQDVFIKVWANRESLNEIENMDAWLSTVTRNLCFNYLKKLALEKNAKQVMLKSQPISEQDVDQYLSYKERRTQVVEAVDQLSPQQRLIFSLNRDQGLKNEEIARQLKLSPNTVKAHLVTALRKIRSFLESHAAHLLSLILFFLKK
jgi:RNA polymerase sigma-70 factor (family 1)